MENQIVKRTIELRAPVARVWKALTDYREFGERFRVKLDAPFAPGETATGHITYPGYEHLKMEMVVQKMEPERLFSYTWHLYAIDPNVDYSREPQTLVELRLEPTPTGTRLTVTESGFENLPAHRRDQAFRMNEGGWAEQIKNIEAYLA
jgi:uncharacterized protein YndB with AHSA1/START domain